jgi:hypothetical protein
MTSHRGSESLALDARESLETFLRAYTENDRTATYDVALVDLNSDGSPRNTSVPPNARQLAG